MRFFFYGIFSKVNSLLGLPDFDVWDAKIKPAILNDYELITVHGLKSIRPKLGGQVLGLIVSIDKERTLDALRRIEGSYNEKSIFVVKPGGERESATVFILDKNTSLGAA